MELKQQFEKAAAAAASLAMLSQEKIDSIIVKLAEATLKNCDRILAANAKDVACYDPESPMRDRLLLTTQRIEAIAHDMLNVAALRSPVGDILSRDVRPNGMIIEKVRVPFGVIGVIYEARPNVSFDVFTLCLKSSNCAILKGGSDAAHSNTEIVEIIKETLHGEGVDENIITLLPTDRQATAELLDAVGYVDLIIPRGSSSLINYVRDNSRVPIIETGAGVCHTYIDEFADTEKAREIIFNAKTRRVSVCNALDTIVVHDSRLGDLAAICSPMAQKEVMIYADPDSYEALKEHWPEQLLAHAEQQHFGKEFLDYKLSIRTVRSIEEAIDHVTRYTSHHSEAIITENLDRATLYSKRIDAACVYLNVSTAFTDGGQFGFGAEIGISTQKLHARGPMALPELTTYKYIIRGEGQVRQ